MRFVYIKAAEVDPLDEHCAVVRKGVHILVTEGKHESDDFLWVERWIWVDNSPSIRSLGSFHWD
jgi:hypothetical protein